MRTNQGFLVEKVTTFKDAIKQLMVVGVQLTPSLPKRLRAIVMIDYKYPEDGCNEGWKLCFNSTSEDYRYSITYNIPYSLRNASFFFC